MWWLKRNLEVHNYSYHQLETIFLYRSPGPSLFKFLIRQVFFFPKSKRGKEIGGESEEWERK